MDELPPLGFHLQLSLFPVEYGERGAYMETHPKKGVTMLQKEHSFCPIILANLGCIWLTKCYTKKGTATSFHRRLSPKIRLIFLNNFANFHRSLKF